MMKRAIGLGIMVTLLMVGCGERDYEAELEQTKQIDNEISAENEQLVKQAKENWYDLGGELVDCALELNFQRCKDAGVEFKDERNEIKDGLQQNEVESAENAQRRAEIERDQATNQ